MELTLIPTMTLSLLAVPISKLTPFMLFHPCFLDLPSNLPKLFIRVWPAGGGCHVNCKHDEIGHKRNVMVIKMNN